MYYFYALEFNEILFKAEDVVSRGDVSPTFKETYSPSPKFRVECIPVWSASLVTSHKLCTSFLRASSWSVLDGVVLWIFLLQVYLCQFLLVSSTISTL